MDISKDIVAAIEQNLPTAVGSVLQKRLEKAEKDALEVAEQTKRAVHWQEQYNQQKELTDRQAGMLRGHSVLEAREAAVAEAERGLKLKEATMELKAEQRLNAELKLTLNGLVRNVEWRSNVYDNINRQQLIPGSGGGGYTQAVSENTSRNESKGAV